MSGEREGNLRILLDDEQVGDIGVLADSTEFRFTRAYLERSPRPVLGQAFEDDVHKVHRSRMQLPPFFSNLLPEHRLRELVAAQIGVSSLREAQILAYLGEDLPGAVRAVPEGLLPAVASDVSLPRQPDHGHPIKFSLAGMQPKLSMLRQGEGLTFPATGSGGDWIVKTPSPRYAGVPENEYLTMSWARASGITVPETLLVPVARLQNMPLAMSSDPGLAFAVRRFDRPEPGRRVHAEDFAQVLGLYPTEREKYQKTNYETIGSILWRLHQPSFEEFVRRLVFVVLSANGDAHVKNWSLWYPDRIRPELAPAYDLVSTIEFIRDDSLALNLAGSRAWGSVRASSFDRLALKVGADPVATTRLALEAVRRTLDAWSDVRPQARPALVERLEQHWKALPLVADDRTGAG